MKNSFSDKPIFIVGAARSGTTLLQYMLRSHSQLSFPTAESHFIIPFYNRRHEFGDLSVLANLITLLENIYQARKNFFDDELPGIKFNPEEMAKNFHKLGITTMPGIFSAIFSENAQGEGKVRWGDKTPYYVLHLDTIIEIFPDAQIIHLIRDGRDCSSSMLNRKDLHFVNTYHTAYTWKKYVQAGKVFGKNNPDFYFELRYEDILNQPEKTIKDLCDFLHIEFDDSIINFKTTVSSDNKTPLLAKPLQKSNQNKWKDTMTAKQLNIFESVAGDTLKDCGYTPACNNPSFNKWDWFSSELEIKLSHLYRKYKIK